MHHKNTYKWHKSVFSLLIAMAMVFSMLPMSAFTSETETTGPGTEIIETIDATAADAGDTNDNTDDTESTTGDGGGGLLLADSETDTLFSTPIWVEISLSATARL